MAKIPKRPEDIFQEFSNDVRDVFGGDVESIILYGSAARGEYVYRRSDINFLVVLTESGMTQLNKAHALVHRWAKRKVSTPLILTRRYIESALDSYPIELLTMKQYHRLVFGRDVLNEIEVAAEHLRLQCEREMRGKLLHMREQYLETNGKPVPIKNLIRITVPAFVSIFSALLFLKGQDNTGSKQQIFDKTAELFELDKNVFDNVLLVWGNSKKMKHDELNSLMQQYVEQIRKLTNIVDTL
ncbi:MAG: hypothetical protein ACOY90_00585 [Candidatus Zhuqueibacterota bacterium]